MIKINQKRNLFRVSIVSLLAVIIAVTAFSGRIFKASVPQASASGIGQSLSLVEINNNFNVMVVRSTDYKTIIYVERLYFDYNPLSNKWLAITKNEETDYCVIELTNAAGEWAKVWGYVRTEEGVRPDDPLQRVTTLHYLEIKQYWEWRTFTNEERWAVKVNDGFNTLDFTFDLGDRKDGAVYYIDGVFGLPERYYPQVAHWWDFTNHNPDLLDLRDNVRERTLEAAQNTPEGEPLRIEPVQFTGSGINFASKPLQSSKNSNELQTGPFNIGLGAVIGLTVAAVAVVTLLVVVEVKQATKKATQGVSNIIDAYDPNQRTPDTPPAPTEKQQEEYNKIVEENPLTETEREELEKRKEFSLDNDAPTGQKIVKLKVKDDAGILQPVFDENGGEVYVNRNTSVIGNSTYAIINRETLLLIRWFPATMELKDVVGNRITVNADNRLMNMDGVQPYSPKSRDDILKKLGDMGRYTSSIDPSRMLYRMDDDDALRRAMNLKENNISVGFWGTIKNAFSNLFGGGSGSKGFLSNLLDVLILIGIVLFGVGAILFVLWFIRKIKGAVGT